MSRADIAAAMSAMERGHTVRTGGGLCWYTLPAFVRAGGTDHGFTTRAGGVSAGCYASLNLSFSRDEDARENVMQNYALLAAAAGFPAESMVMDAYEHGAVVRRVDARDRERGYTRAPLPPCDGLVTNDPGVTLVTGHADCMAFYFYDPVRRAIGLAHAGWRGALHRIGPATVREMTAAYGTDPGDVLAGVGPSICPDCFEVDGDVAALFRTAFPGLPCEKPPENGKKTRVDLWMVAAAQFMEAGVQPGNISFMNVCTVEDTALYSHRRDRGQTGGMAAFLRLV